MPTGSSSFAGKVDALYRAARRKKKGARLRFPLVKPRY